MATWVAAIASSEIDAAIRQSRLVSSWCCARRRRASIKCSARIWVQPPDVGVSDSGSSRAVGAREISARARTVTSIEWGTPTSRK